MNENNIIDMAKIPEVPKNKPEMTTEQKAELEAAFAVYLQYVRESLDMLPEHNKKYWSERVTKAGTWQTKMRVCQSIRERYEADYRKRQAEAPVVSVDPVEEKKPVKNKSKKA